MPFTQLLKGCGPGWSLFRFCQPMTKWVSARVIGVRDGSWAAASPDAASQAAAAITGILMPWKAQTGGKQGHGPLFLAHHANRSLRRDPRPGLVLRRPFVPGRIHGPDRTA